jgi:hypothetical protein
MDYSNVGWHVTVALMTCNLSFENVSVNESDIVQKCSQVT